MTATVRAGTKSSAAIAVMVKHATWSMEKVVPKIADATGLDMDKAKHYYVLFVRKGLAPGVVTKTEKVLKQIKVKAAIAAKIVKAVKPTGPVKSAEEIEKIKAANLARMKSVLGKVKQHVRKEEADSLGFVETDPFASPAFLTKDEVTALV